MSRVSSSPSSTTGATHWPQLYTGLGFTTLATLILELSLTRIFSVVFYYHLAFLAISIALFGLGAGGVYSYVVAAWPRDLFAKLGAMSIASSAAVVLALAFLLAERGELKWTGLAAIYFASAIPFFLAGVVVSLAISETIERVGRAYFFDLAGAGAGCLLLIPFLDYFGGPNTVISAAVFYAVAAAIWFNLTGGTKRRAAAVLLSLVLVGLMVVNGRLHWIDVHDAKGHPLPQEQFVEWNSFSRVGVHSLTIDIDSDASTGIADFDWDHLSPAQIAELQQSGANSPYVIRPGAKSLVIGAGGGWDVARSLISGSSDITAVEINPIIANHIMRGEFAAASHRLYFRPEVHIFVEDGRSFVRRTSDKYQVIQATLVDTWASTAAGAFALSENNLYTSDAFYDYLTHLTDDGLLAFTRWGFDPPRESLRVVALAIDALDRLHQAEPQRHVIVVRQDSALLEGRGSQDTILISRRPFTATDIDRLRASLGPANLQQVFIPGDAASNPFGNLLLAKDRGAFYKTYPFDVAPVDDDRPFFFYTVQTDDLWDYLRHGNESNIDFKINRAVPLLFALIGVSILATALILVLPRLLLRSSLPRHRGVLAFLWYFLCLGAGYIVVQVAMIQKFVLLLGRPTYALTVIVFSMLAASGVGSFFSRRLVRDNDSRLMWILAAVAILIGGIAFAAAPVAAAAAGWTMSGKVAITAICIAPGAFLMGVPFPSGLRRLEHLHPPSIRWAWSVNAAASVFGSAGAIVLAIYLGLRATMLIGAALYLAALLTIAFTRSQPGTATGAARISL